MTCSSSDEDIPLVQSFASRVEKNRQLNVKSSQKSFSQSDVNGVKGKHIAGSTASSPRIRSERLSNGAVGHESKKPASNKSSPNGLVKTGKRKLISGLSNGQECTSNGENMPEKSAKESIKRRKTSASPATIKIESPAQQRLKNSKPTQAGVEPDSDSDIDSSSRNRNFKTMSNHRKVQSTLSDEDDRPLLPRKRVQVKTESGKVKVKSSRPSQTPEKKSMVKVERDKTHAKLKAEKKDSVKAEDDEREKAEAELEEEDDDEEFKWWKNPIQGDGIKKWTTLEHNGVVFPPPYQPLPDDVHLIYDGVPVKLPVDAEEIAGFYGAMLHSTVNTQNPTFNKNFFGDFMAMLKKVGPAISKVNGKCITIEEFDKCDFTNIHAHYEAEREHKRSLPPAEKKALKAAKEAAEAPYMYCFWDGRKQKVGNFRVEPPGLFRGRGDHPKTGMVKKRVMPEQITINIGKEAKVPEPPANHRWKEVKHDQEGTWLAMWQENINGSYKYVMLAANSDIKGQSDFKKFEKARELKKHIDRIRKDYTRDLKSELMADRQRATAVYLIDKFALRAGNEKGEDEADTVGCCSLKFEHVTLKPPNRVIFDFLGKDSIRYYDEVEVDTQVFKNLKIFKKPPKGEGDEIFDRLTTSALNRHLGTYMQGLTAKVFRTYNASWTMARLLLEMRPTGSIPERVKEYNDANRKVAILCNHKRTVAASHSTQIERMQEKVKGLRYQQWRLKQMMLVLEPKLVNVKGKEFFDRPEDLTTEWIEQHQATVIEEQRQKIRKKFEKENEKLLAEGEKIQDTEILEQRLEAVCELEERYSRENETGNIEVEGRNPTLDKLEANIEKFDQRIETTRLQMQDKDDNKEVALGTSKINYIDPRLTVVFSKRFNVPIERFFSKTLREKFDWAIKSVDENWDF